MVAIDRDDVRCRYCGGTYNLRRVTVVARYADCTVYKTPCCDRQADDRTWTGAPAFTRIADEVDEDGVRYFYPDARGA